MGKLFNNAGHILAWCFHKIVSGAPVVAADAQKIENVIESPIGQFLAGLGGNIGKQVQDDGEAVLGAVIAAATSSGVAVAAKGMNIADDEVAVAALERLVATVGGLFGKSAPVASAPAAK